MRRVRCSVASERTECIHLIFGALRSACMCFPSIWDRALGEGIARSSGPRFFSAGFPEATRSHKGKAKTCNLIIITEAKLARKFFFSNFTEIVLSRIYSSKARRTNENFNMIHFKGLPTTESTNSLVGAKTDECYIQSKFLHVKGE